MLRSLRMIAGRRPLSPIGGSLYLAGKVPAENG